MRFVYLYGPDVMAGELKELPGVFCFESFPMICFEYSFRKLRYATNLHPQSKYAVVEGESNHNLLGALERSGRLGVKVINMSLAPGQSEDAEGGPVTFAIEHLARKGCIIVVAAGNSGPGEGTTTPWCRSPWTIGVGATDASGERLKGYSAIGYSANDSDGPTVVACGDVQAYLLPGGEGDAGHGSAVQTILSGQENVQQPNTFLWTSSGTSFSAPRVSKMCMLFLCMEKMVLQVGQRLSELSNIVVDGDYTKAKKMLLSTAYRTAQISDASEASQTSYERLVDSWLLLEKVSGDPFRALALSKPVDRVRGLLQLCAKPIKGLKDYQIGYGFVSDAVVYEAVSKMSAKDYFEALFGRQLDINPNNQIFDKLFFMQAISELNREIQFIDMNIFNPAMEN